METKMKGELLDVRTSGALIAELAARAAGVEVKTLPGDGREMLIHNFAAGLYEFRHVEPPVRSHKVYSVESFVAAALWHAQNGGRPVAWHGHDAVVLVCDDADRRDTITLGLPESAAMACLRGLDARPAAMDQGTLVRVLRLRLGQPPELVAKFRRLDFAAAKTGVARVEHGRESLGREITAAVQGIDGLPETIDVAVRVTDVPGANQVQTIRVGVEIDAPREQFYLAPMPGELEAAVDRMHADLHARLESALVGIPVYYGAP